MASNPFQLPDRTGSGPNSEVALRNRNQVLESTLQAERETWGKREAELLAEIQALKLDHEHCAEDYDALKGYAEGLREGKKEDVGTIAELKEKLAEANRRAEAGETAVEELAKLKVEKEGIEAMIKIVVHTRLRFLFQALSVVPEARPRIPPGAINQYIKTGNAAAHAGCGTADAQLFLDHHIPPSLLPGMTLIFKNIYRMTPTEFVALSEKEKVAIDCEVTIRVLQVQNNSISRPIAQRQQALDHIEIIRMKASKMSRAEFENDADVERRLGLVKELVAEIVDGDRLNSLSGGSPSTKDRPAPRRPSSKYYK
ncbi:hypothetical protein HYFRA_00012279 [Hymenoscyphus fraxineus]|uniref:Uncharacterized protein n=1 Tax=Hymenoscyphus fraxineus TaxID=746836 RepID=A0A9N9PUZ3_9HELO|nr:hypothetical protein HYFRA_00012279 [Hymenoscyphus fraxineus]